jgi:hypothetical protein
MLNTDMEMFYDFTMDTEDTLDDDKSYLSACSFTATTDCAAGSSFDRATEFAEV